MQFRCSACTKTIALGATGVLPTACPHCNAPPGPGPLGQWEPVRLLAAGGMGEVYLARHRDLGTEVALKVLPAMPLDLLASVRERFAREARLTARVRHPGVVKIHGNDTAGDRPYLVLEFVAGSTLRERLRRGPLPIAEAARIAAATADVLAAAHAEGVLHRDVKPDNVMLEPDGSVRVLDFGIARAVQDDAPITRTGEIVGTPEYMAPEQLLDGPEATTERTDVHALGVLLYELLTARSPFHGANVFQALKLVESLVPPPLSAHLGPAASPLDGVVRRALEKQPADRFPTAAAFAAAIRDAVPSARTTAAIPPAPDRRTVFAIAALVAVLAATAFVFQPASPAPATPPLATGPTPEARRAEAEALANEGRWSESLVLAERLLDGGDEGARPLARAAFVHHRLAWTLAAGAPAWLSWTDEPRRARLFGADGETTRGEQAWREAAGQLRGSDAAHDESLARLLTARASAPDLRAEAFAAIAGRLPLGSAEHWLARMLELHCRGDRAARMHAAEMAWLQGAGEIAVLLDAWLEITDAATGALRDPQAAPRLRARVAAGAGKDSPANGLLVMLMDALHGEAVDATWLPPLTMPDRGDALGWFVDAAAANPSHGRALQGLATFVTEKSRGH
ncbi:MAG: serine/threonine protein kinase [Planctomycetes bacterium]|nr:serine/threonine protein kinase [Planctomycetota bacterium]